RRWAAWAPKIRLASAVATLLPAPAASAVATTSVASTETTFARRRRRRCQGGRHGVLVDLLLDRLSLGGELVDGRLPAQVEAPLAVDLGRLDDDLVADVSNLFDALDAVVGQLGDV